MSQLSTSKHAAWLRAARLESHVIVVLVFGACVAAGALDARSLDATRALLAYVCVFLLLLAGTLSAEHFDHPGDRINDNAGRWSGGSRVLVTGALTQEQVLRSVAVAIALVGAASGLLLAISPPGIRIPVLALFALGATLSLGHTAPPLKLGHRGFGEINAAITHATFPALVGWVSQGGAVSDPLPWLISMPAFCAWLGARTLAGIPDRQADAAVRRRTYAVIFGPRGAAAVALIAIFGASIAGILLWSDRIVSGWFGMAFLATVPHALALAGGVISRMRAGAGGHRMDAILLGALLFTWWFGLIPFAYYVRLVRG